MTLINLLKFFVKRKQYSMLDTRAYDLFSCLFLFYFILFCFVFGFHFVLFLFLFSLPLNEFNFNDLSFFSFTHQEFTEDFNDPNTLFRFVPVIFFITMCFSSLLLFNFSYYKVKNYVQG